MNAPLPQHGSPLVRSSLVLVNWPQPPPRLRGRAHLVVELGGVGDTRDFFIVGSEEDSCSEPKQLSVFLSSDDQLEDSDSDEHSRSDSVTGTKSWTTS